MPRPTSGVLRLWIPSTRMPKRYVHRGVMIEQLRISGRWQRLSDLSTFTASIIHTYSDNGATHTRMGWPCDHTPPPCRRLQVRVNSEDEGTGSGFMYSPSMLSLSSANSSNGNLQGAALGAQRLQSTASPLPSANNVPYYTEQRPSLARRPCMSPFQRTPLLCSCISYTCLISAPLAIVSGTALGG